MVSDTEPRYRLVDSNGTVVGSLYAQGDGTLAIQEGSSGGDNEVTVGTDGTFGAPAISTEDARFSQPNWEAVTLSSYASGGDGTQANPWTSGLQAAINDLESRLGIFSKSIVINGDISTNITLPAANYRISSEIGQVVRVLTDDADNAHCIDDAGFGGHNFVDLWVENDDTSGTYDVFHLSGDEEHLSRLDIESVGGPARSGVRASGVDEFKMDNSHLQGTYAEASMRFEDATDVQIDSVDDSTGAPWEFVNTASGSRTMRVEIENCITVGKISVVPDGGAAPLYAGVSNCFVGGGLEFSGGWLTASGLQSQETVTFSGGEDCRVSAVINGPTGDGVVFDGGVSDSMYVGTVHSAGASTVNFTNASDCLYIGNVNEGVTYGASQTDCNVWPIGGASGTVSVAGTRPRWMGVIGGGLIDGVDLGSHPGAYVGDLGISDGTTKVAGTKYRWDGAAWNPISA